MSIQNYVSLRASDHRYFDLDDREYSSVSKVLNGIEEKVDWEAIAGNCAGKGKYKGMSKAEVLAAWDANKNVAANHGTRNHNALERYSKEFNILPEDMDLEPMIKSIAATYVDYYQVHDEACLYSEKYGVAGTADKILIVAKGSRFVDIEDFKTNLNKGIVFNNSSNKYFLDPVSHLQNCNFNRYALQLSIYGLMYENLTGNRVRNLWIRFIPADNPLDHYRIMIPYMKYDAEAILAKHAYGNNVTILPFPVSAEEENNEIPNFNI